MDFTPLCWIVGVGGYVLALAAFLIGEWASEGKECDQSNGSDFQ